ncbi:hypothetical protein JCM10296v2_007290 [Rhodotorula toruloides]
MRGLQSLEQLPLEQLVEQSRRSSRNSSWSSLPSRAHSPSAYSPLSDRTLANSPTSDDGKFAWNPHRWGKDEVGEEDWEGRGARMGPGEGTVAERWMAWLAGRRSRRLVAVVTVAVVLIFGTLASTHDTPLRPVVQAGAARTSSVLSAASKSVSSWFYRNRKTHEWERPFVVEWDGNVTFERYLRDLDFIPFPMPLSPSLYATGKAREARNEKLPHRSYTAGSERNAVFLTLATAKYVPSIQLWAARANDLGLPSDNVVVICLDDECLVDCEKRGVRAYGGFRQSVYGHRVPDIGVGGGVPDLRRRSLDLAGKEEHRFARVKREGFAGGLERRPLMQYVKFRALYELNAAGFASLFFEADTTLTTDIFKFMRPLTLTFGELKQPFDLLNSTLEDRRMRPSPYAHTPPLTMKLPASTLVDPGWDLIFTQDGLHFVNFGWILSRPTPATIAFWRKCLTTYVARGGWDQGLVTEVIRESGWSMDWRRGWWEEPSKDLGFQNKEDVSKLTGVFEPQKQEYLEQWHFANDLTGIQPREGLRIALLPLKKFFAYHWWLARHYDPAADMVDPIVHHLTFVEFPIRQYWPKERGWHADIGGYYSRPRPILVPINATLTPRDRSTGRDPVMQYSSDNPPGTFYYEDAPDFPESTFVGYMHEVLHYWRIMQLLAAVGDRPRAVAAESTPKSLAKRSATSGEGRAWSVMLPKEAGIFEHQNPPIWAWWSRIVDVSDAVTADLDILEPAFFTHTEPYLSPADREKWQSNRLRLSLADYDSLPALVESLRDILEPYSPVPAPSSEPGFFSWMSLSPAEVETPPMGLVVELTDWDAALDWKLDDLSASERAPDVKFKEWEDLKKTRHCQKWWEPLIPGGWCTPQE